MPGQAAHAPGVGHERRGDAEADDVGEGVELDAEFGGSAGHAGHAAVQRIKEDCEADGFGGAIEFFRTAHEGGDHGVVAAEQIRHREHAGQQKNAAAQFCAAQPAFLEGNFLLLEFSHLYVRFSAVERFSSKETCLCARGCVDFARGGQ